MCLGYDEELARAPQQKWLNANAGACVFGFVTNDLASLISATSSGVGPAALPHILAKEEKALVCVMDTPEATRELWLLVHPDLQHSAHVRAVVDFLVEITASLRATPSGPPPELEPARLVNRAARKKKSSPDS